MIISEDLKQQAECFAHAYLEGKPARMPGMLFSQWPEFIAKIKELQGESIISRK